jgi:A nuclease family of the HNH/ENDO VII superfamily with conserved AHH
VRNWGTSNYNSNGFANKTSMPSGSMSATFDEDGKVLSASGSVSQQDFFSGRAFSHLDGIGHGAKGGEGAAVLVAKRDVSRDRLGTFQGSVTTSISPVVNTNSTTGETTLAFDDGDPVITGTKYGYQNETDNRTVYQIFHGSVSASGNSFLVTDSGDLPEGESSSTNMLLPETDFGVDSSYGNPIVGLAPWEGFDAPFTSSGTWPGGANSSGGGGSSGGGNNGAQPGDSPLTLGTGNNLDLGMFSSAYGYKGETVGASFAWQLPTTGTPTEPTSFGDAVFNSGNFQSPQEPGNSNNGVTLPDESSIDAVLRAYRELFGADDRLLRAAEAAGVGFYHQDIDWSGGKLYSVWTRGTPVPWPYSAPELQDTDAIYLDDSVTDPFLAAVQLRAALWDGLGRWANMRNEYGLHSGKELDDFQTLTEAQREHWAKVADEFGELVETGVSVIDIVDIGMAINDLAEGEKGSYIRAAVTVLPFIPGTAVRRIGKYAFIPGEFVQKLSADLANSLKKADIPNPYPVAAQAHHIFPVHLWGSELAHRLRNWGIDLNAAENGMWLPAADYAGRLAPIHRGGHTKAYYEWVEDLLNQATTREDALRILEDIKDQLERGIRGL